MPTPRASILRALTRGLALVLLTGSAAALPVVSTAAPTPVTPGTTSLPVVGVDRAALAAAPRVPADSSGTSVSPDATGRSRAASAVVAMTAERRTEPFRLVGVTWSGGRTDVAVHVRTRTGGTWTSWQDLAVTDEHDADAGTAEGRRSRGGTEPLFVAASDGIQVRVDDLAGGGTGAPADVRATLVDPGRSTADATLGQPAATAAGAVTRPTVLTREQWGADESLRRAEPSYGTVKAGFVHHTVSSNTYSAAEVPAMIRAIYAYHVEGRGWDDIGYNFVVDRFGRVWEGRYGGADQPVIGAHTSGYNSQSFAMSALGDFSGTPVPTAVQDAFARVYAWKLGLHHVRPTAYAWLRRSGEPTLVTRSISGHRDAGTTACPGDVLYGRLDAIRSAALTAQGAMFYSPRTTGTTQPYATGGPTVSAKVSGRIAYQLEVSHPCGGVVRVRRGFASSTDPIETGWSGRLADGSWAPPGYYTMTLTATDRTGASAPVPVWTSGRVWIKSSPDAPPSFCQQAGTP